MADFSFTRTLLEGVSVRKVKDDSYMHDKYVTTAL